MSIHAAMPSPPLSELPRAAVAQPPAAATTPAPVDSFAGPRPAAASPVGEALDLDLLRTLLTELLPLVQARTGWWVDLSEINLAVVDPTQLTEFQLGSLRVRSQITLHDWARVVDKVRQDLVPSDTMAVFFEPAHNSIVVQQTNARTLSVEALRAALFGMLVHCAQKQQFGAYYAELAELERRYLEALAARGAGDAATRDLDDTVQARWGWLRGQVRSLQDAAIAHDFPGAQGSFGLGGLMRGLLGSIGYRALFAERDGQRVYDLLAARDPRLVERCFRDPRCVDAVLRRQGTVVFNVPATTEAVATEQITELRRLAGGRCKVEVKAG